MRHESIAAVQDRLRDTDHNTFLAADPANLYYLTGVDAFTGFLLITEHRAIPVASRFSRYTVDTDHVYMDEAEKDDVLTDLVEPPVACDSTARIHDSFPDADQTGWVEALRAVKTPAEITKLRDAAAVTVHGMEKAVDMLRNELSNGVNAFDVAAETEYLFKKHGCTNAFHTAGPGDNLIQVNAAAPHTPLTAQPIQSEDVVIVDIGARNDKYCMDMTRTFCQDPSQDVREMFAAVKAAQETCINMLETGVACAAVDSEARSVVADHGFDPDKYFLHGVGHGIGINVHEKPWLSRDSEDVLEAGNVVTVEPGLYIPGVGGVRIEDTVLVTENGAEVLTGYEKTL